MSGTSEMAAQLNAEGTMKLGISLPLVDLHGDPATVRDFAQAAEGVGYHHLGAPDHLLAVNVAIRPDAYLGSRRPEVCG